MTDAGDMAPSFACTANTVALQLVIAEPTFTRIDHPLRVAGVSNGNVGTQALAPISRTSGENAFPALVGSFPHLPGARLGAC
jgi:hypothetical protein